MIRKGIQRAAPVGLLLVVATCEAGLRIPADLRTPTVANVIESIEQQPDGEWVYELRDGQTLKIDYDETDNLRGGLEVGWLLLFGTDPNGRQWVAGVSGDWRGRPDGCFLMGGRGRAVDGWIETEGGLRLPKAADFHDPRDAANDLFTSDQGVFCLNRRGEIFSYDVR